MPRSSLALAALALLLLAQPADARRDYRCHAAGVTAEFDGMFRKAARRHLPPGFDWCWLKAWAMAESNLDPDAVSPVGAVGILQVMPKTGEWIAKRYGGPSREPSDLRNAAINIETATIYIAHLERFWSYPRPEFCRKKLQMASFNAGEGNVVKAQKLSGGRRCWKHISAFMHRVTGQKHSEETISYVNTIVENYLRLKGLIS